MVYFAHMQGSASLKVFGGKLLRISVNFHEVVESVKITGDFFLYPEESITDVEHALSGLSARASEREILRALCDDPKCRSVQFVGVSFDDIATTLHDALLS